MPTTALLVKSSTGERGRISQVHVPTDATVACLKEILAARLFPGIPARSLRVRTGRTVLAPDSSRLREVGVTATSLLHVEVEQGGDLTGAVAGRGDEPGVIPDIARPRSRGGDEGNQLARALASAREEQNVGATHRSELKEVAAHMDSAALEERLREEITKMLASQGEVLRRLVQVEDAVHRPSGTEQQAALESKYARMIDKIDAKLHAIEASRDLAATPEHSPAVLSDVMARLDRLEEQLASSREGPQCSCAEAVEKLQERLDALEKYVSRNDEDVPGRAPAAVEKAAAAPTSSGADLETKMEALESSIKTLEEKVKLQAKRSDQIIKEQRQRAVAQGV
jgi:hypothetical protein